MKPVTRSTARRVLIVLALSWIPLVAQDSVYIRAHYTKHEYMIPMRDSVRLFAAVYMPKDTTENHPIIMTRTPYGCSPYGEDQYPSNVQKQRRAYFHEDYIIVYQDVRGRFMSEGEYENVRPYIEKKKGNKDIDETTDTYDTVDWLVKHIPHNNGRVGISGVSYPGFYSSMGAIDAHPAVKAVSPQAPVSRWMGGDDFFHNGALLLPHAFDFFSVFGKPRPKPTTEHLPRFDHGTPDGYKFFLELGPLPDANTKYLKDSVAFWNQIMQHGTWDSFWAARDILPHLKNIKPATMFVGGWFDTENLYGALHSYAAVEKSTPNHFNVLVMGPWSHGQWAANDGEALGDIQWGSSTSNYYTDSIEVPFFDYFLQGKGEPKKFEAAVFETGTNRWRFLDSWPSKNVELKSIYLHARGLLTFEPPKSGSGYDEYVSDPMRPVPYTDEIRQWYNPAFMDEDQRFADRRPDVLVYRTDVLSSDVTIAGPITVSLYGSTSGTDCDWIVKMIDVFPDDTPDSELNPCPVHMGGYEMLIRGDVLRGKFRHSLSTPEPIKPGKITRFEYQLEDVFHTFKKGHRIMVQVQSTWFPMIDRNPGRFEDIYRAKESDFQKTRQRVYRSAKYSTHLTFNVLN
jgi:putative CocE/NonD family hydrolase